MLATVASYIEQHHLLPENGTVVVAVSGGANSLCLLHILKQLCGPPIHPAKSSPNSSDAASASSFARQDARRGRENAIPRYNCILRTSTINYEARKANGTRPMSSK